MPQQLPVAPELQMTEIVDHFYSPAQFPAPNVGKEVFELKGLCSSDNAGSLEGPPFLCRVNGFLTGIIVLYLVCICAASLRHQCLAGIF
jgi:hypothetical protein